MVCRPVVLSPDLALDHYPAAGRVGLLALASDFCLEDDLRRMLPSTIGVFTNRVTNRMPLTHENLEAMRGDIARAAAALLPGGQPDCYVYGCTSGTAVIGEDTLVRDIHVATGQNVPIINPLGAAFAALQLLGISRLSLLTPYTASVSQAVADQLEQAGYTLIAHCCLGLDDDYSITCTPLEQWREATHRMLKQVSASPQAVFISCTSTRASLILEQLEDEFGIPFLSSNQCLAYATHKALGQPLRQHGFGQLLRWDKDSMVSA